MHGRAHTHTHASLWSGCVPTVLSGPNPRVSCPESVGSDFPLESWAVLSLVLLLLPPCPAVLMSPFSPCIKTLAELVRLSSNLSLALFFFFFNSKDFFDVDHLKNLY